MKWMNANKTSIVEGGAPLGKTKRVDSNGVQTKEMRSEAIRSCRPNRMVRPRRYSAKTILTANARRMDRNPRDHAVAWDVVTNASCIAAVRSLVSVASTSALGHSRHVWLREKASALPLKVDILRGG